MHSKVHNELLLQRSEMQDLNLKYINQKSIIESLQEIKKSLQDDNK